MANQDKLIKQGIKYTDRLFDEISKRLEQTVKTSDTLESFLEKYHKAFPDKDNPLIALGYDVGMLDIILQETNNHKFSRPAQKELTRVTIEQKVGEKIVDVGEDIKESVREIVKDGYNNNLSQQEIAENISSKISSIKNKRARAIARTEIARTATICDYVINAERGATHFYVECRNTACPICKKAWHKGWTPENDGSFTPSEYTASNKGWVGDKYYPMSNTSALPPIHPNCYHKDTKVFTNHGWKYFYDITENDKILSLNPETNETEFLDYVKLIKVPNIHGYLHHIHNRWFDVCVTPDHDCFIHKRRDGGKRGRYFEPQFRKPSNLNSECHFVRCIDVDRESPKMININGLEFQPEDFAFFMAWFLSEGSVLHNPETARKHSFPVKIAQEIGGNREVIQPVLERICESFGLRLTVGKSYFEMYCKELHDYLEPLGYSHEKYIPKEVFLLDKECLNIFLDNYVLGDGHERTESNALVSNSNERMLFTSSKRLRDDLSYLILLCGYYPSIGIHVPKGTVTKHWNGEYTQKHDTYRISINKSKYTTYGSCTVDELSYDDFVYCVELPKWHTLWVMSNGKTSWNGNCRCVPYFIKKEDNSFVNFKEMTPTKDSPLHLKLNNEKIINNAKTTSSKGTIYRLLTEIPKVTAMLSLAGYHWNNCDTEIECLTVLTKDGRLISDVFEGVEGETRFPESVLKEPVKNILFTLHNHRYGAIIPSGNDIHNVIYPNISFTGIVSEKNLGLIINKNEYLNKHQIEEIENTFYFFNEYVTFCFDLDCKKNKRELKKNCSSKEEYKKKEKQLFDKYVSKNNSKFVNEFNDRMERYNIELVYIKI